MSKTYVWDVEVFAHYFDCEPPASAVVAMQSFNEAMHKTSVGPYEIINPPDIGTLVVITPTFRYMTTDSLLSWLGDMNLHHALKTREVISWLVHCGARKADALRIQELVDTVKNLEQKLCERDCIIHSLQRDITNVLRLYYGRPR
jgi:hypothetical protein